jgi:hypothetical protein
VSFAEVQGCDWTAGLRCAACVPGMRGRKAAVTPPSPHKPQRVHYAAARGDPRLLASRFERSSSRGRRIDDSELSGVL